MTMTNIKETRETISFSGQFINIGLDVHKKNWSASIYLGDKFVKTFHQESTRTILLKHLKVNYPDAVYKAFYEAGFYGFSVQRELTALAIACSVVNAADIPQTNKGIT